MAISLLNQLVTSLCGRGCVVNVTVNASGIRTGEMKHFSPAGKETIRLAYWTKEEATRMAIWAATNFERACLGLELVADVVPNFPARFIEPYAFASPIMLDLLRRDGVDV